MKLCPRCETEKPLSEFGKHKKRKDGLRRECLVCSRLIRREWKLQNPERVKEIDTKSRSTAASKEKRTEYDKARYLEKTDEIKQRAKLWASENRDRLYATKAKWCAANREKVRAIKEKWRLKNLVYGRIREARRRARKRNSGGEYTMSDVNSLLKLQRGKCACCKSPLKKYHVDHVVALARGGSNDKINIQLLCPRCNVRKSAKDPVEFMQENGYLL